ncbi:MAG: hypothetical protein VB082_10795 [Christensenella sp.]|nr:hypothetical protein [Christensenella sp.]
MWEERRKKEEEARQKREEATRQQNSAPQSTHKVYNHEEYTKEQDQKSYGSDVYGSVDKPKQVGTKKSSAMSNAGYANDVYGSVNKPKYGGAKKNTPQSLFGTPGMKPGNPFGVPGAIKQPDDADRIMNVLENEYGWGNTKKDAGMDNAGYANDVYGSVNQPKYGGTAAKKPQALPGLTPLGKDELTPEQEKVFLDTLFEVPEKTDPIPTYGPKGETKEEKTMRELIGYITEDDYQPETPQEYAKRLVEEKQQQAAMNNAGYANENGVPEKLVAEGGTFWGGGDSRPQASVSDGSTKASNRASWDDGSVNHPKYGGTVAKKPRALPGLTPGGAQTGNAFSLPQTPGAATSSAMDNAGYANDVYGSVSNPKYGGTVAKKPQVLPGLTPPGAAENIMGGSTLNGTGMLYNKNNPEKITANGINLGASAYNYNKGQNNAVDLAAAQQYAAGLPEGMKDYLKSHPNETLPNGINGAVIEQLEKQYLQQGGQTLTSQDDLPINTERIILPGYVKDLEDIQEMQSALGIAETGVWDENTEQAYRERMNQLTGLIYQDDPRLAGLPFDKDGMEANGCSTTATHNVLQLMGIDVPFEQTYAWHREHGDENWSGTIPWRTEEYVKEMVPEATIRNAAMEYPVITPATEDTLPLEERAQRVVNEDGYGILCYTYPSANGKGIGGAHYVAVQKDPKSGEILVYDYTNEENGIRTTGAIAYPTIHDFMNRKGGWLISAYGLSVNEEERQ